MYLEHNLGDEVWAIIDVTVTNEQECPTCGQNVVRSTVACQTAFGKILGIDISLRQEKTLVRYTVDFDGMISDNILQVWKTRQEAERILDLNFPGVENGTNF